MLENCSASANSKLISGPLSICMKQAHLKPPQENDLIIFNYLEWALGLEAPGILASFFFWELLLILGGKDREKVLRSNSFDKHYSRS